MVKLIYALEGEIVSMKNVSNWYVTNQMLMSKQKKHPYS